jgi:hypothetical protein
MVPKIMLEGGHAWVHERPIAAQEALHHCALRSRQKQQRAGFELLLKS